MTITKRRLYAQDATSVVRDARGIQDAASWTPDNLSAGEVSGGVTADDVTLDAREWKTLRLVVDFEQPAGTPHAGGTVDVTPLYSTPDPNSPNGRKWREGSATGAFDSDAFVEVAPEGHDVAFRITALALTGADIAILKVTGGELFENRPR
jgi:hypothetical protein